MTKSLSFHSLLFPSLIPLVLDDVCGHKVVKMSATDQMRAMLDQLMGTARDGEEAKRQKLSFTDSRVCKSFLLDCCPHDILASTVSQS